MKNRAALGKTVVLTSHFMDEAHYLADRLVVIAKGRIVAAGPPATLGFRDRAKVLVATGCLPASFPRPAWADRMGPAALSRWRSTTLCPMSAGFWDGRSSNTSTQTASRSRALHSKTTTSLSPNPPPMRVLTRPQWSGEEGRHERLGSHLLASPLCQQGFLAQPLRAFPTFALPLMFLVIFTALLGNGRDHVGAIWLKESTYYVATMATFAMIQACYTNIAVSLAGPRSPVSGLHVESTVARGGSRIQ